MSGSGRSAASATAGSLLAASAFSFSACVCAATSAPRSAVFFSMPSPRMYLPCAALGSALGPRSHDPGTQDRAGQGSQCSQSVSPLKPSQAAEAGESMTAWPGMGRQGRAHDSTASTFQLSRHDADTKTERVRASWQSCTTARLQPKQG